MSYRIPFLRGNTRKEDHTHWRTAPATERPDATIAYPGEFLTGFTVDEIMQISWRIKSWKLTCSYSARLDDYDRNPITQDWYGTTVTNLPIRSYQRTQNLHVIPDFNWRTAVTEMPSEVRLFDFANPKLRMFSPGSVEIIPPSYPQITSGAAVGADNGNFGFSTLADVGNAKYGTPTDFYWHHAYSSSPLAPPAYGIFDTPLRDQDFFLRLTLARQQPVRAVNPNQPPQHQVFFDAATGLFYPSVVMEAGLQYANKVVRISTINRGPFLAAGRVTSVGSLAILSQSVPLYLYAITTTQVFPTNGEPTYYQGFVPSSVAFSGTLTPFEYWPYQNSLGQPVYDTTTGAQINAPFA